jgi:2-furoyl-CoA dehydrogenase large subunit
MVAGQVTGGFAHALGAALYEEHSYAPDGSFQTGTFADYLVPTPTEVPDLVILHHETPSPFTPLGAKGVGEGNCMSTPACIGNAVADALGLATVTLPVTPARLAEHVFPSEREPPARPRPAAKPSAGGERGLFGEGEARVAAPPEALWSILFDPTTLQAIVPGAHRVEKLSDSHFRAEVTLGIGPVKGRYTVELELTDPVPPRSVTLSGSAEGGLGSGQGSGQVTLEPTPDGGTIIRYRYDAAVGGKVASVGGRLLDGAARMVIGQFFAALASHAAGGTRRTSLLAWLRRLLGLGS